MREKRRKLEGKFTNIKILSEDKSWFWIVFVSNRALHQSALGRITRKRISYTG